MYYSDAFDVTYVNVLQLLRVSDTILNSATSQIIVERIAFKLLTSQISGISALLG